MSQAYFIRVELNLFTLTIGLWTIWTGPYLSHSHQHTEVSHQLTLKIASLISEYFFRKTIVDNELVHTGSLLLSELFGFLLHTPGHTR